jgi:hypothetical protein
VKAARIRVRLGGVYSGSRRWATFTAANDRATSLAVEESDVEGDLMVVGIVDEYDGEVVIRLPRAGLAGEWIAVVPRTSIIPDTTRSSCLALLSVGLLVLAVATAVIVWAAT